QQTKIKVTLNLILVHARGLNIPHKRTTVLEFLRKKNIDFAMIKESHLLCKDAGRLANKIYHPIATSSAATKSKGVMVLCKCKLKFDMIASWADDAGRIAFAKIRMDGKNIAVISAYAPNAFDVAFYELSTKSLLDLTGFHLVPGQISMRCGTATWTQQVTSRVGTSVLRLRRSASGRPIQAWSTFGVCLTPL
uniref:Endonuclease/exonuclease/phosphatase domain-containing protein n=1 Tax=Sparus aurata TaxID=8175 RepID=A0A671XWN1_SPAAU